MKIRAEGKFNIHTWGHSWAMHHVTNGMSWWVENSLSVHSQMLPSTWDIM